LTHYAKVFGDYRNLNMPGVEEFVNAYNENPNMDFHTMVAEMADIPRKQAKVINLAMMYGMGAQKLAGQLDIHLDDAKALVKKYHSRVPFVKGLTQGIQRHLRRSTLSGLYTKHQGAQVSVRLVGAGQF
jgi:hypothetical protein